ncbi:MAG: GNAT family N-acetyltransferase [Ktedonobacterales bacterium]
MKIVRPAHENDLGAIYEVWYQTEVLPESSGASPHPVSGPIIAHLRHVLQTGTLLVAEREGTVAAFAGAITRGDITYLTDLFVHPLHQSAELGKTLLQAALPENGLIHSTVSSSDPRALALYIRAGMTPQWPYFGLRLERRRSAWEEVPHGLEVARAEPGDLHDLVHVDAERSGRYRQEEHAFWIQQERAVPVWFRRQGHPIGYGYVRLGAGTLWHPEACAIGPIGAESAEEATACVLAAVGWAAQRAEVIRIAVPGPHPCLAPLLDRGFLITYMDTFVSTAPAPFFDACCYVPSGGDLL